MRGLLETRLLPRAVRALGDSDAAVPLYALKLLASALAAAPELAQQAYALGCAPHAFAFLRLEHACNNVHNVRLCLLLAACAEVPSAALAALDAGPRAAEVLAFAFSTGVQPFLEPALGICRALLERARHERRLEGGGCARLLATAALRPLRGAFRQLSLAEEQPFVAELAADCLALLDEEELEAVST